MESKAWLARALALALVVPAAAACNKEDKTQENIEVKTEAPPPAAPITVQINPQGGSKISGDLTATHETGKVTLRLNLSGLDEKKDYEAKVRYGDCTVAMQYLADNDEPGTVDKDKAPAATTAPGTTAPNSTAAGTTAAPGETARNHDIGDVVTKIDIDKTGATATGSADVDNDKLGAEEPAFVAIVEDAGVGKNDMLVGCADLTGHAGMSGTMGGMSGAAPAPGTATTPGAATPADTGKKKY